MAMEKPCVVPDLGPMRDVIVDNVTGLLFPHADYAALKRAILRCVEDSTLRSQLGARAKDTVLQRHTWVANARIVVQLAAGERPAGAFAQLKQLDCDTH